MFESNFHISHFLSFLYVDEHMKRGKWLYVEGNA